MLFTIKELKQLFTSSEQSFNDTKRIEQVNIDSRKTVKDSLFIPIIGENFNGHDFVEQAISNGAIAIVWDEKETLPSSIPSNFPVFFTKDTTQALQLLATYYRDQVNPTVIAITGSNGKTTTKDLVSSLVKTSYKTHATKGNLNNHIGLPLTILTMPRETEVMVLELGMNDFGEIELLSQIAKPDCAIITNIGESHIEYLGSREGIAKAKLEIISGLKATGTLIVDGDEPLLERIPNEKEFDVVRVGFSESNDIHIINIEVAVDGTSFTLANQETFYVPLLGEHHAKNATLALQVAERLNIDSKSQIEGLKELTHTSSRFEIIQGKKGATLVDDSYNASPTSMKGAIEVIKRMEGYSKKILVLGDILELGSFTDELHRSIGVVITSPITHLYTYGEKAQLTMDNVSQYEKIKMKHYPTKEELTNDLLNELEENCIVLFKASRGIQFETIIEPLTVEQKKHEEQ